MESTPATQAELVLRRVGLRVNLGVFLTKAVLPVAAVIIAFAVVLLFTRMLAPQYSRYAFLLLVGIPVAMAWAGSICRQRNLFYNEVELVELADHLSASDGMAATAYERSSASGGRAWETVASRLHTHPLRLRASWFAWRLLPAMVFAAAVFLVPPRQPKPAGNDNVMLAITQPLAEKIEMTTDVLPEPEREQLKQQLEQVQAAPEGVSREKWEAVEDMEQRLENALAQSEASAYQLSSSMNQLAGLVSQQETKAPNVNSAELQSDIDALASSITDQMKKNSTPLSQELKEAMEKAMGNCKGGNCKSSELSDLLKHVNGLSEKLSKATGDSKNYGRGGVDRGRADAPLVIGDERILENAAFDSKQLENQFFEAADLTDIGITPMEPKADPGMFQPGTVKSFGVQQGTNVSRTQISPSQRGVVSRYFE